MTSAVSTRAGTAAARPVGGRRSRLLFASLLLGLALVAAPFAFQMFSRAPKGAVMLQEFKPYMTQARLTGYQSDIAEIDAAVVQLNQANVPVARNDATFGSFSGQWPAIRDEMNRLIGTVHGNLGNYQAVAALPSFRLFPWFFVAPGLIISAASAFALWRPQAIPGVRVVLVVIGIGLVLAPLVFGMFTRAPKGGHMMTAFRSLETTQEVEKIQGYFAAMAVGQGEMRLHIEPALQRSGEALPAVDKVDGDWVHILNDMTPMIGAMSDNVVNYDAIKALPPFPLFPWFFVIPGVIVAGLAIGIRRPVSDAGRPVAAGDDAPAPAGGQQPVLDGEHPPAVKGRA